MSHTDTLRGMKYMTKPLYGKDFTTNWALNDGFFTNRTVLLTCRNT